MAETVVCVCVCVCVAVTTQECNVDHGCYGRAGPINQSSINDNQSACVRARVCACARVLVPPNIYIHT